MGRGAEEERQVEGRCMGMRQLSSRTYSAAIFTKAIHRLYKLQIVPVFSRCQIMLQRCGLGSCCAPRKHTSIVSLIEYPVIAIVPTQAPDVDANATQCLGRGVCFRTRLPCERKKCPQAGRTRAGTDDEHGIFLRPPSTPQAPHLPTTHIAILRSPRAPANAARFDGGVSTSPSPRFCRPRKTLRAGL